MARLQHRVEAERVVVDAAVVAPAVMGQHRLRLRRRPREKSRPCRRRHRLELPPQREREVPEVPVVAAGRRRHAVSPIGLVTRHILRESS